MTGDDKIGFNSLHKLPRPPRFAMVLSEAGGVMGMVRLKADDDLTAAIQAKALVDGHAIELWDGMRYIEHFLPVD